VISFQKVRSNPGSDDRGSKLEPRFCAFQKVGSLLNPVLKMTVIRADFDPTFRVD